MNKEWSDLNEIMQWQIKKRDNYSLGIETLIELRKLLMEQMLQFKNELEELDFSAMPFVNANGYHNKTIAYSLWHIFRIEDIVTNTLIADREQVFFEKDYQKRMNSPIITTGNELVKEQIGEFSKQLNIDELYQYITDVDEATTSIILSLKFEDMKTKITDKKRRKLQDLNVVSEDENAYWLIDYW